MHIKDQHYHVYNRGAHKAPIFLDISDYRRFLALLYIGNDEKAIGRNTINNFSWIPYLKNELVDIFAYCLMSNHFHLGLKEKTENGIEQFMRKICTSYSMYYNLKYKHSGTIFQGNCKSKLVDEDSYLKYLIQYIHLNPFSIDEPHLTNGAKLDFSNEATRIAGTYEFSSYKDYLGEPRPQCIILCRGGTYVT